ncbi:MAG: beta-ketoacyl-[acyl-carrier-protein] synthase family protein [Gemmatimonadetes bacterium]|nr:beta-ketoacyl-[acyl-carrier-protein] synthase family protein [Gemmatimonadota bacterium]
MGARRVAVTGVGAVSALGVGAAELWAGLSDGRSGIGPIESADCSTLRFANGAEVHGFDPAAHFERRAAEMMDRFSQFAVVAAREAVAMAGVEWTPGLREETAVVVGSGVGGQISEERAFVDSYFTDRGRTHPLSIPRAMMNAATSQVTMDLGVHGPAFTVSTACSSSNHAIGQAFWMVRSGTAEMAVAGGAEAPFALAHLKGWDALRAVSPDTCRPFTRGRQGMVLGEGAAMLVLEPLEAARARGAPVLAELVGFGMSADASHVTVPSAEGAARAVRAALRDAELSPERVEYVNAHGTGTAVNDPMETAALRAVFGAHADRLAVSATKSMHGHALGASGALEAVATVLALRHGLLPPTANFTEPDPECDLDVVPNRARAAQVEHAISNSFAFGGLNAVLAFRRGDA